MEVLSLTIKAGGAGEIWRCVVESAAISGARWVTHPSNNMEGGAIISIFLITRTIGVSGGTPALWSTAGLVFVRG